MESSTLDDQALDGSDSEMTGESFARELGLASAELDVPCDDDTIHWELEHFSLSSTRASAGSQQPRLKSGGVSNSQTVPALPQDRRVWGDFVALSYTWVHPEHTNSTLAKGHRATVRRNLEIALRALCNRPPIRTGATVWVNAICVDRDDVSEQSTQVERMRIMFKSVREVVVWPGDGADRGDDEAVRLMKTLAASCQRGHDDTIATDMRRAPDMYGKGVWRSLPQLLSRLYWTRVWIMQDVATGGDHAPMLLGVYVFGGSRDNGPLFSLGEQDCEDDGIKYTGLVRNGIVHSRETVNHTPMMHLAQKLSGN